MATVCLAAFLMLTAAKLVVAVVRLRRRYRGPAAVVREQKKPQSPVALRFDVTRFAGQRGLAGDGRLDVERACGAVAAGLAAGAVAVAAGAGFAAGADAGGAAGAGFVDAV